MPQLECACEGGVEVTFQTIRRGQRIWDDLAEEVREDIGDYDRIGKGARFFDPQPKRPDIKRKRAK